MWIALPKSTTRSTETLEQGAELNLMLLLGVMMLMMIVIRQIWWWTVVRQLDPINNSSINMSLKNCLPVGRNMIMWRSQEEICIHLTKRQGKCSSHLKTISGRKTFNSLQEHKSKTATTVSSMLSTYIWAGLTSSQDTNILRHAEFFWGKRLKPRLRNSSQQGFH